MVSLLHEAKARGGEVVVFPELALTTFFPRCYTEDETELDAWFETQMPNADVQPLFDAAAKLNVGFYLGYAELVLQNGKKHRFNTSIIVDGSGKSLGNTAKFICPVISKMSPGGHFNISKSVTLSLET